MSLRALQQFHQEVSPLAKYPGKDDLDRLEEPLLGGPVGLPNPREFGGGIGEQDVAAPFQKSENLFANLGVFDIAHKREHILILKRGLNRRQVDTSNSPAGTNRSRGFLEPAPWPTAEIGDPLAGSENPVAPLEFGELVDRARTKPLALGALVEMVLPVVAGDGAAT